VAGAGEFAPRKMPTRVMSIERPAPDVAILTMQLPANDAFRYHAGQFVEFILRDGSRRSYSMANAPHTLAQQPTVALHIRHMPGGKFTDHVFGAMKEKEILRIEGPFGSFFLREDSDKPIVLLASGTGFAPIKAIIEHMEFKGITRPAVLYWGCRSKADLYRHDWAESAARRIPGLRYVPVLSEPKPEDAWTGRTGFVHQAVMQDLPDLSDHQVYACGAPIMVDSARRDFVAKCALPEDAFFADSFTSEADKHGG
jgi:CDP-4-dehydro-6-deoxyglucose reductase